MITLGVLGVPLTAMQRAVPDPQVLFAATQILPVLKLDENVTWTELDPCPLLIVTPAGTVQV